MNNMKKCRLNDLSVINLRGNSLFVAVLVFHQRICVSRPEQESNRERECHVCGLQVLSRL